TSSHSSANDMRGFIDKNASKSDPLCGKSDAAFFRSVLYKLTQYDYCGEGHLHGASATQGRESIGHTSKARKAWERLAGIQTWRRRNSQPHCTTPGDILCC